MTSQALRAIDKAKDFGVVAETGNAAVYDGIKPILNQADSEGGKNAFMQLSFAGIILIIVFGILLLRDRAKGGYQQEHLVTAGETEETATAY